MSIFFYDMQYAYYYRKWLHTTFSSLGSSEKNSFLPLPFNQFLQFYSKQ